MVCDSCEDRTVTYLTGAKVTDIMYPLDRLVENAGEKVVVLYVSTKDMGECSQKALDAKFRLLGKKLKARTSMVVFLEVLPLPRTGPAGAGGAQGSQHVDVRGRSLDLLDTGEQFGRSRASTRGTGFT